MDQIEYRAVFKFLTKEGKHAKEIHNRLTAVYDDTAPSFATAKHWHKEFRRGRESLEDDPFMAFACTPFYAVQRVAYTFVCFGLSPILR